ncbi:MAG: pectinesterase family protein [Bryobacteraceae bacterium]|jgi:pectinesterase
MLHIRVFSFAAAMAAGAFLAAGQDVHVVVAQDGTGDFPTVQNALDHALDKAPIGGRGRLYIEIRPGTYRERVVVPQDMPRVTLVGKDAATTIITHGQTAKETGGTFFSATVDVDGAGFEAQNITFENPAQGAQAVAVSVHSDRAIFRDYRFIGWQDTLYAASGRQYYVHCYISGHVDFIFGNAAAVFEDCEIHSRGNGYLTAVRRTRADEPTGFVLIGSRLTADEGVTSVALGRPWRLYARVVYIDCWMGPQIVPGGWNNWNKPEAEKTAFYGEYHSTGPGARLEARVAWSHQLTATEAAAFRPEVFLRGNDGWNPAK